MMRTHTALHILCGTMFREYRKNLTKRRLFVPVSTSVFRSVTAADRVDYPALERSIQQWWEEHAVLQRYLHRNDHSDKQFSFLDGPFRRWIINPVRCRHRAEYTCA